MEFRIFAVNEESVRDMFENHKSKEYEIQIFYNKQALDAIHTLFGQWLIRT